MGAIANYPLGSLIYFLVFIIGTVLANEAQASDRKKNNFIHSVYISFVFRSKD